MIGIILRVTAALLLATSAILQLNDPDPLFWTLTYGAAALVPAAQVANIELPDIFRGGVLGLCIAGLLMSAPGFARFATQGSFELITADMSADPFVEPAREFLGALIAIILLAICWRFSTR